MIPKVIYQTFYTKKLPRNIQNLIESMKKINPEFEFFLYDDDEIENFIKNEFDERVYSAFKMLNVGSAKADLWRYCILYKNGGVYLDMDSEITQNLNFLDLDNSSAIVSRESHKGIFLQWCLMFEPNHPILKICLERCVNNILNKKTENILYLTGPVVFSDSVLEYCKVLNIDIWSTNDDETNIIIKDNGLNLRIYSTDFRNFCRFKNSFYLDLENFNLSNNKYKHWSEEKKIFNNEDNIS